MSSVPRHSEEELRQQWAFLDALVDRQAASLKSGIQDPEEDDAVVPMVARRLALPGRDLHPHATCDLARGRAHHALAAHRPLRRGAHGGGVRAVKPRSRRAWPQSGLSPRNGPVCSLSGPGHRWWPPIQDRSWLRLQPRRPLPKCNPRRLPGQCLSPRPLQSRRHRRHRRRQLPRDVARAGGSGSGSSGSGGLGTPPLGHADELTQRLGGRRARRDLAQQRLALREQLGVRQLSPAGGRDHPAR